VAARRRGLATGSGAGSRLRRGLATNGWLRRAGERWSWRLEVELATEIWLAAWRVGVATDGMGGMGIGGARGVEGVGGGTAGFCFWG
jgi:hypothetical protein